MKKINKLGKVLTRIIEICHWVGAALMIAATVCLAVAPKWVGSFVTFESAECCGAYLEVYGFEINAPTVDGMVDRTLFIIFCIGAVIILSVMAMIFRNLYLIFQRSENATPFLKDNVRLMREIGIFTIAIPVIGLMMSIIARLVGGADSAEFSIDMSGVLMGIIVLCLTQFFAHGVELESDVDGLV